MARYSQTVVLDKAGYSVLKVVNTHRGSWKEKPFYLQETLHFGDYGRSPFRWIYLLGGLLVSMLPLTGYAIQWLRTKRSMRTFWRWTSFGLVYSLGSFVLLKTQGINVTMAYGQVFLWTFAEGPGIYWMSERARAKKLKSPGEILPLLRRSPK